MNVTNSRGGEVPMKNLLVQTLTILYPSINECMPGKFVGYFVIACAAV
jgi:hypothetical protein